MTEGVCLTGKRIARTISRTGEVRIVVPFTMEGKRLLFDTLTLSI
jgi:hypothetical protein